MKKRFIYFVCLLVCILSIIPSAFSGTFQDPITTVEPVPQSDQIISGTQSVSDGSSDTVFQNMKNNSVIQEVYDNVIPITEGSVVQEVYDNEIKNTYFKLTFSDSYFSSYSPMEVLKRVENNVPNWNDTFLVHLNKFYSPWVNFTSEREINNSWCEINSETRIILGDVLATEDFTKVGICVGKNMIFSLEDGNILPAISFKYINRDFQIKTLKEIW